MRKNFIFECKFNHFPKIKQDLWVSSYLSCIYDKVGMLAFHINLHIRIQHIASYPFCIPNLSQVYIFHLAINIHIVQICILHISLKHIYQCIYYHYMFASHTDITHHLSIQVKNSSSQDIYQQSCKQMVLYGMAYQNNKLFLGLCMLSILQQS